MTTLALVAPEDEPRSWESVLAGAIRPEFAVERYVPGPGSVLFGKRKCAVAGCMLPTHRSLLFCGGHDRQWRRRGGGQAADEWVSLKAVAGGPTEMRGRARAVKCAVADCPRSARSAVSRGLCAAHYEHWRVRPDTSVPLGAFIATAWTALPARGRFVMPVASLAVSSRAAAQPSCAITTSTCSRCGRGLASPRIRRMSWRTSWRASSAPGCRSTASPGCRAAALGDAVRTAVPKRRSQDRFLRRDVLDRAASAARARRVLAV